MKKFYPLVFAMLLLLTACSQGESAGAGTSQPAIPEPLEVDLRVPETANQGETVLLQAVVTQGAEVVTDADEVEFEIWQTEQKDSSELIPAVHQGEGVYTAETVFTGGGVYSVQSHVTARDMHTMPKSSVTVHGSESAAEGTDSHEHGQHSHGALAVHLEVPETVKASEPALFTVHVQNEESYLTEADVTLEIWQDGSDQHKWVDLTEIVEAYTGSTVFSDPGTYHVQIHVMKENAGIHEHAETIVEVME